MITKVLRVSFFLLTISFSVTNLKAQSKDISTLVQFTNDVYKMGKITTGQPVEYSLTITNTSSDTLSIQQVKAGCGCTTPKYQAGQVLKPGDVATVTLGFDGRTVGPFTKFATIYFGNGLTKQVQFSGEAVKQ